MSCASGSFCLESEEQADDSRSADVKKDNGNEYEGNYLFVIIRFEEDVEQCDEQEQYHRFCHAEYHRDAQIGIEARAPSC